MPRPLDCPQAETATRGFGSENLVPELPSTPVIQYDREQCEPHFGSIHITAADSKKLHQLRMALLYEICKGL